MVDWRILFTLNNSIPNPKLRLYKRIFLFNANLYSNTGTVPLLKNIPVHFFCYEVFDGLLFSILFFFLFSKLEPSTYGGEFV